MRTVERTPSSGGIEPAIGTTTTHLAIDDDAGVPRTVALVAILAGNGGQLAGNMGEEGLHVAAAAEVEDLFRAPLRCEAHAGLTGQALGQRALDDDRAVPGLLGQDLSGSRRRPVSVGMGVGMAVGGVLNVGASQARVVLIRVLHAAG